MVLPVIDWNISVGNIIQIVSLLGACAAMFFAMRSDIRVIRHDLGNLKQRQNDLNEAFTQLGKILTQVAVQDQRILAVERMVEELRHGQGYVNPMRS